jgi:hypothetical protein
LKALLIVFAIVCAWISGVGMAVGNRDQRLGGLVFLVLAILAGMLVWRL